MAQSSLFFTEREVHLIHQNISPQNELKKDISNSGDLYLSAIVYVDESHWSLCLNNRIIRSDGLHQIDGFHIEEVAPLKVKFSWLPPHSALPLSFTLHPNQMFLPNENRIIPKIN